jgi:hypothetical protein
MNLVTLKLFIQLMMRVIWFSQILLIHITSFKKKYQPHVFIL